MTGAGSADENNALLAIPQQQQQQASAALADEICKHLYSTHHLNTNPTHPGFSLNEK